MVELDAKERDLLGRVKKSPELRALFFRKVKGVRWFSSLKADGYFEVKSLPRPVPSGQEGYVKIPRWDIVDYLERTSQELSLPENEAIAQQVVQLLIDATSYARKEGFSNHQTWWKFSTILSKIPNRLLPLSIVDVVDYWFDDPFDRGLVTDEIGNIWLGGLLRDEGEHAADLAVGVLRVLFQVVRTERKVGSTIRATANLRLSQYSAREITVAIAEQSGRRLGVRAVEIFKAYLESALKMENSDSWSSIWQPSVEDHEQNKHHDRAENILVLGYRDSLDGVFASRPRDAAEMVTEMLVGESQIAQRIAIYQVTRHVDLLENELDTVLAERFFSANYRHETWHFLHTTYGRLRETQKELVRQIIRSLDRRAETGEVLVEASAYERAIWLSAIKDLGEDELQQYLQAVEVAKAEPRNPDFSSFSTSGWVETRSPLSDSELASLEIPELIHAISEFSESGEWESPSREGLANTFKKVVKSAPIRFISDLKAFKNLDALYLNSLIESYSELWLEKASLPWDDVWASLLDFILVVVNDAEFWTQDPQIDKRGLLVNRDWVVGSIGRLIESGVKSDDHSFPERMDDRAEAIVATLLRHQPGREFREASDAVSTAINSPRGHCLEALINLALRMCRAEDRRSKDHMKAWARCQPLFDAELKQTETFEFPTLVTNYLPNFLYLSKEWTLANLTTVFDMSNTIRWRCAIQGYSYTSQVYENVYTFLRDGGHFAKALDDEHFEDEVRNKIVQNVVIAYVNDLESLDEKEGLITALLKRRRSDELGHLVWFVWSMRKDDDLKLTSKVFDLWKRLSEDLNLANGADRKLAASLTQWAAYVGDLDTERTALLEKIAPYSDESHNSSQILVSLARMSKVRPLQAHKVWMRILERSAPTYPHEAVRELLANLLAAGTEGRRAADVVVSEYLRYGDESPSVWLHELDRLSRPTV